MTVFYITTRPTSGPPYTTSVDVALAPLALTKGGQFFCCWISSIWA